MQHLVILLANDVSEFDPNLVDVVDGAIGQLREMEVETTMAYPDFAILFAIVQGENVLRPPNGEPIAELPNASEYLSRYLKRRPEQSVVPEDSRLDAEDVEKYLRKIEEVGLIEKTSDGYKMDMNIMGIITEMLDTYRTQDLERYALIGVVWYGMVNSAYSLRQYGQTVQ